MRGLSLTLFCLAAAGAAIAVHLQGSNLYVNGALASTGVIERNGVAYAPLKDIAKSMNLTVQKTARGYELSQAGGANMVEGLNGKIGDTLFNGFARFTVLKVWRAREYRCELRSDHMELKPSSQDRDLVLISCRIKSGVDYSVLVSIPGGADTMLTDTDEHAYKARLVDAINYGPDMLPGSAAEFVLIYEVPTQARPKDLVYQLAMYARTPGADKKRFRVSLAQ